MANTLKDGLEWLPLLAAVSVYNSPRRVNSKKSSIYTVGQRSIPSTFLFHPSIRSNGSNEDVEIKIPVRSVQKFLSGLNKKLHKSSALSSSGCFPEVLNILSFLDSS
nr:uncharacterized protein LOC109175786 [Ipomoea batatas]